MGIDSYCEIYDVTDNGSFLLENGLGELVDRKLQVVLYDVSGKVIWKSNSFQRNATIRNTYLDRTATVASLSEANNRYNIAYLNNETNNIIIISIEAQI
jgi:hypothetical protein